MKFLKKLEEFPQYAKKIYSGEHTMVLSNHIEEYTSSNRYIKLVVERLEESSAIVHVALKDKNYVLTQVITFSRKFRKKIKMTNCASPLTLKNHRSINNLVYLFIIYFSGRQWQSYV